MATDYFSTIRAFPFFPFSFQKLLQTVLFDVLQIVNHIHSILLLISLAKLRDKFTGKLVAFIAELHLIVQKLITFLFNKRALLVSRTTPYTVRQFDPFRFSIIYQSKIVATHITVHTTNRNQFRLQVINLLTTTFAVDVYQTRFKWFGLTYNIGFRDR